MTEIAECLTISEASLLAECEEVIERGMGVFIEVGTALMAVRDSRLYRTEFATFEEYCRERWQLEASHAYKMIDAARVVELISSPNGGEDLLPATERQARELAPLLDLPDELRDVWQRAVERTEGKPTAAAIRQIVREATDEAEAQAAEARRQREVTDELNSITARIDPEKFRDDLGVDITWPVIRALEKLVQMPTPSDVATLWPAHLRDRLDAVIGPAHEWLADLYKNWGSANE